MRWIVAGLAAALWSGPVAAAEWVATKAGAESETQLRSVDPRWNGEETFTPPEGTLLLPATKAGPEGLPDGYLATADYVSRLGGQPEADAKALYYYAQPTDRYPHGALGDDIEGGSLVARWGDNGENRADFELPDDQVFEDRTPLIVDLDGFGRPASITILSDAAKGASVAVFGLEDARLKLLAQTPYIGTPNRWLNIAGIDDFDGSGSSSIALVETPHIGGTLQFWRWSKGQLTLTAEARGFSNHKFGSREQRLSAVEDFDDDGVSDLAVPSADRKSLKLVRLSGRKNPQIEIIAEVALPAPIDKAIGVSRQGDDVVLTVGLEDGSVWAVHRR